MLSRFDRIPGRNGQTDGRTVRQTDRIAISISRVSVVCVWTACECEGRREMVTAGTFQRGNDATSQRTCRRSDRLCFNSGVVSHRAGQMSYARHAWARQQTELRLQRCRRHQRRSQVLLFSYYASARPD